MQPIITYIASVCTYMHVVIIGGRNEEKGREDGEADEWSDGWESSVGRAIAESQRRSRRVEEAALQLWQR